MNNPNDDTCSKHSVDDEDMLLSLNIGNLAEMTAELVAPEAKLDERMTEGLVDDKRLITI